MPESTSPQQAYLEAGRYAIITVICIVAFYLLAFFYFKTELAAVSPPHNATQAEIDQSIQHFNQLMEELLVLTILQSIIFSAVLIRIANRTIALKQFPPSATMLLKRTKIIRGGKTAKIAIGFYLLAIMSWLPVAIPVYLKWIMASL